MHFWNKLSTAALMRLSLLASLNLFVGRFVGYWDLLHPLFFLILVTLNLGLYAVMVYSGTINKTLIAMMLAGLAGVLAVVAYAGLGASAFAYGGPYRDLANGIEWLVDALIRAFPRSGFRAPPKTFWWRHGRDIVHVVVDAIGLVVILATGLLARARQARWSRREPTALSPSS